jgi:hypothetical protein
MGLINNAVQVTGMVIEARDVGQVTMMVIEDRSRDRDIAQVTTMIKKDRSRDRDINKSRGRRDMAMEKGGKISL